jgi:CubicO group peptidase (beta-lactamase class C family)
MNWKQVFAIGITASTLFATPVFAQDQAAVQDEIQNLLDEQGVPGAAVIITQNGDVTFEQGFGVRSLETQEAVTADTLFMIGSITKPLTAIAILQLVETGEIDLDAPVVDYLPEFKASESLTIRQLLSHNAGLMDGFGSEAPLEEIVLALTPDKLFAEPGAVWSYSNMGYGVLGAVIERVSGQPYTDYMAEQVFVPLGLERTTFDPAVAATYPLAVGYMDGDDGLETVRPLPTAGIAPAGYAYSTAEDLTRLATFLMNNGELAGEQLLPADLVELMKTPVVGIDALGFHYGLGLDIEEHEGETLIGHGGDIEGYAAQMLFVPESQTTVVVLSNKLFFPASDVAEMLVSSSQGSSQPLPTVALDQSALENYAGNYAFYEVERGLRSAMTISLSDNDTLQVDAGEFGWFELRPIGADLFARVDGEAWIGQYVQFIRDADGQVKYAQDVFTQRALVKAS